jgi:conjugative relaxase-like TrwC/TraI family protein
VTEEQMLALFGLGRHPNARAIEDQMAAAGAPPGLRDAATKLGHAYHQYEPRAFQAALAAACRDWNVARGERPNAPIPADQRARLRTELANERFCADHGRDPLNPQEITGYLTRVSRPAPVPVAGYDLTFSPVKSVSALWAIAPGELADKIAACHDEAVRDTIGWLEQHAVYTRRGTNGIAQVDTSGLIAAAFTHRDSRAADPDLHTHVAVSNKVCTLDGRWLSLDGRALYRNKVAASEHYNSRLEALLTRRVGVRFAERGDAAGGRREVREIVGVAPALLRRWSSRRGEIEAELEVLSRRFQDDHGRPPTSAEREDLAQQATLSTREAKHEPRAEAEQRRVWRAQASETLGGAEQIEEMLGRTVGRPAIPLPAPDVDVLARRVIETVQATRATWQEHHVRAEVARQCHRPDVVPDFFENLVTERVLSPAHSVLLTVPADIDEPEILRRADGTSVYEVAGSRRYTSVELLDAESRILSEAAHRDFRVVDRSVVDGALLASLGDDIRLGPDQAEMVRQLATSGARVQLALAPAGSGKTLTLRSLAEVWAADGDAVVGLAPTAAAARVLRTELGENVLATDTIAKLVHALTTKSAVPEWLGAIGPGSLVIIDEAGMAGTIELATVIEHAITVGAAVRLVGDDRQLAAVGAGGVLRDIARTHGTVTLSDVRRFTLPDGSPNHAEAAASLAIRRGDAGALGYYLDHGRIHVGDAATSADQAFAAWSADRADGLDTLLIASTNELVRQLNLRAQQQRLAQAASAPERRVTLADGTTASAGDAIITRRNDRRITLSASDWVANGDRWTVASVRRDGSLDVRHARSRKLVTLPGDYVARDVQLGYACTVHAAQGQTVDTSHTVLTGTESRQLLYVALTRGRCANDVYLDLRIGGEEAVRYAEDIRPPTAVELLTAVIERDDAAMSATSTGRAEQDPAALLNKACAMYLDSLNVAAEELLGEDGLAEIHSLAEASVPGITANPGWPRLSNDMQWLVLDGKDAREELSSAKYWANRSAPADARADALAHSMERRHRTQGPQPWLPPIPQLIAEDEFWSHYFQRRLDLIQAHSDAVGAAASRWTQETAPAWAVATLHDPDLTRDLATWRAGRGIDDTDLRPTGPATTGRLCTAQGALDMRVEDAGGLPTMFEVPTRFAAKAIDPAFTADPYWPVLAAQLEVADRLGIDRAELLRIAAERPLPADLPAAAFAYRLIAAIGGRPVPEAADSSSGSLGYESAGAAAPAPSYSLGYGTPGVSPSR